jgi:glycosyltransferase involved in cell wall biosynthesis
LLKYAIPGRVFTFQIDGLLQVKLNPHTSIRHFMRILICSYRFSPEVGGIETCSLTLADAFRKQGHSVTIVTQSKSDHVEDDFNFKVLRRPSIFAFAQAAREADLIWQNNISVFWLSITKLMGKPCFVTTQTWLTHASGKTRLVDHLKRFILSFSHNLYISRSIADHVGWCGQLVANPYDHSNFQVMPDSARNSDLVFLGRLVSDKGSDLMLQALVKLRDEHNLKPSLSLIGSGPEEEKLREFVAENQLHTQVSFKGVLRGTDLSKALNEHKILIVPSRWFEPFGIVALEGIACGLAAIVSSGGGLPEAIGPCGLSFTNDNVDELTNALHRLLSNKVLLEELTSHREEHLEHFKAHHIAERYTKTFELAL